MDEILQAGALAPDENVNTKQNPNGVKWNFAYLSLVI